MIKITLICLLALLPLVTRAGKITMSTPDEQELKAGRGFVLTKTDFICSR